MWEEGVCIYGTPGVYNNFPIKIYWVELSKATIKFIAKLYPLRNYNKKKKKNSNSTIILVDIYKTRWVQVTPGVTSKELHIFVAIDFYKI